MKHSARVIRICLNYRLLNEIVCLFVHRRISKGNFYILCHRISCSYGKVKKKKKRYWIIIIINNDSWKMTIITRAREESVSANCSLPLIVLEGISHEGCSFLDSCTGGSEVRRRFARHGTSEALALTVSRDNEKYGNSE